MITGVEDNGVRISNNHTGHGTLLAWDRIHNYATDPDTGDRNGFLILNTHITSRALCAHASGHATRTAAIQVRSRRCAVPLSLLGPRLRDRERLKRRRHFTDLNGSAGPYARGLRGCGSLDHWGKIFSF